MSIESRAKKLVRNYMYLDVKESCFMSTNITDDLGADSLDMVGLVMATEEEFEIDISDEEWNKVETVRDIANLVHDIYAVMSAKPRLQR